MTYDLLAPEGEGDGIAKEHANDKVLKLLKDAGVSTVLRHSLQQTFAGIAQWLSDATNSFLNCSWILPQKGKRT